MRVLRVAKGGVENEGYSLQEKSDEGNESRKPFAERMLV